MIIGKTLLNILDNDIRPTYGLINFNLRLLPISTSLQKQENFLTTIHEIVHILGFSSTLYQYYINPTPTNPKNPKTVLLYFFIKNCLIFIARKPGMEKLLDT